MEDQSEELSSLSIWSQALSFIYTSLGKIFIFRSLIDVNQYFVKMVVIHKLGTFTFRLYGLKSITILELNGKMAYRILPF